MTPTLQLEEEVVQLHAAPKLLVEWSSPWQEFCTAIRPALARSDARLAGEAPFGLIPYKISIPTYLLEAFLIFTVIVVKVKIDELRPVVAPRFSSHDVIYYTGDELPRTQDLGGAEAGSTGRAGGQEAHNRTQTIKIARGGSLVPKVVDAPNVKLPSSRDPVANLLAIRPDAGPPPSEGMRSARNAPSLATPLVAPAPNVIRDYTRNGISLEGPAPPAPNVAHDQRATAPTYSVAVVPPAPNIASDHMLVAPELAPNVIPPAPGVSRERAAALPSLTPSVSAPASDVNPDKARSAPALAANVIPPAPTAVNREFSGAPVQMTNLAVVPPPVSAPERTTNHRDPMLALPAPAVVAPPPSSEVSRDVRRQTIGNMPDPTKVVVPPPPSQANSGSYVSNLIGKIFGPAEVTPPPPAVDSSNAKRSAPSLTANVVAPPPTVAASAAGGNPKGNRQGMGSAIGSNVVAPPSSTGLSAGTGSRASTTAPNIGLPNVVPPPPSLNGAGGGSANTAGGAGAPRGTLLAANVAPPPPSLSGGSAATGSGLGRRGEGLGAPMDIGAPVAPPKSGGSGSNAGTIVSSQPGPKAGLPTTGGPGSLAMSPSGGDKPGLGGAGRGTSIGRGNGPGSGMKGEASGAGKTGSGLGSDATARGGISPSPGPGGAGNAAGGTPPVRGVSVEGGTVTLPSFGSDSDPASDPTGKHAGRKHSDTLGVTVVATATSGGAFESYKNLLKGETATTYLDTSLGTVVMEFADEVAKGQSTGGSLTAPQAIRSDLPEGLPRARMVISCTLDASGNLKNLRVREAGPADVTAKIVAALRAWKFQPAMRGDQPVEVTAILGFGINTDDRF